MPTERPLPTPNQPSPITDSIQFGAVWPTYTWRKGGTENPEDDHLYLTIGSADELLVPEDDALIEIDPRTRFVKFWGATELLEGVSFGENTIYGNSLVDGTITSDKLQPGITIDGSVARLTTARNINGIKFDGTSDVNNFGLVNTAGNNARKTTTITNFQAVAGAIVTLRFTNNNTAQDPTLNVSETGDYPIRYDGTAIVPTKLVNNRIYSFVFDGVAYNLIGDLYQETIDEFVTNELINNDENYNLVLTNNTNTNTSHLQFANSITYNPAQQTLTVNSINSGVAGSWNQIHDQQGSIINSTSGSNVVGLATYKNANGLFAIVGTANSLSASFTTTDDLDLDTPTYVVNLLDTSGNTTFPNTVKATKFDGTATLAEKATSDSAGNNIIDTYATKQQLTAQYLPLVGGELTGTLKIPAVGSELNTVASTVGYVDAQISTAVEQVKQEIIGTAGDFGTISDLTNQVTENAETIEQLQQQANNFVRFDQAQSLQPDQQATARDNIGAYNANGGIIDGNVVITGDLTASSSVSIRNSNIVADQPPTQSQSTSIYVTNADNTNDVGGVGVTVNTNNSTTTELVAKTNALLGTYQTISITSNPDGSATTFAPAPSANSNDNSIATTQWVNNSITQAIRESQTAIAHKLYTDVLAATMYTTLDQGLGYFSEIVPQDSLTSWQVSYLVKITVPYNEYNAIALIEMIGVGQQYSYRYTVAHNSADVKSFDGINFRPATTSSMASGIGHYVGLSMYHSTNPDVVGYERDIDVTVIKQENCTAKLLDNIAIGSTIPDIETTHEAGRNVDTRDTGFYYQSNINYGDRLSAWDRLPAVGNTQLIENTIVAEDSGNRLVSVYSNGQFTTTPFNPYSLLYYTGDTLDANAAGNVQGTLYNVHRFDTAVLGNSASLSIGARLFLKGTLNKTTWLFTATEFTTDLDYQDQDAYYLLIGYAGSGTIGYLIDNHILYGLIDGNYVPINPVPVVATPPNTSNDNTIATTAFVQQIAANVSAGSLINPEINTDDSAYTNIFINGPSGNFVRGQTPTNTKKSVNQSIVFRDGTPLDREAFEDSTVGYVEAWNDATTSSISVTSIKPDGVGDESYVSMDIGYRKQGSVWTSYAELSQSPDSDDNSKAIATTEYVQNNLTGICAYCNCTTAAGTAAKVGTVPKYKLVTGATVIVDFANGNTATDPTLNINNTGAKAIKSGGAAIGELGANTCLMFVYTGTEYHAIGLPLNNPVVTGTLTIN